MPITDHYHGEVLIFCYYKWRGQAENPFLQVIQSCAALCSSVGVEVIVGRVLIMLGCSYTVRRGTLGDCQHHNTTEKITNTTSPQKKLRKHRCRNGPFYQYGGHIDLIRFKEYYRMPRGHEHLSFAFSSIFRDIFS